MRTREQIEKELNENIPREAVSSRSGGGTKQLSYLETWYVIDRLNRVFGSLGWDSETREMRLLPGDVPAYVATVRITVSVPETDSSGAIVGFRSVYKDGTGWGSDKSKMNPHEMAAKEAESDALKRAAMKFGISMGLGLYEKTGEYVEEAAAKPPATQAGGGDRAAPPASVAVLPNHGPQGTNRDAINKGIAANAKVLQAKGKKTVDEIKKEAQAKYGVEQIPSGLSDEQAAELLKNLKEQANGQ